jgi:uncharacterized repeat protein (TIGR01451 family)
MPRKSRSADFDALRFVADIDRSFVSSNAAAGRFSRRAKALGLALLFAGAATAQAASVDLTAAVSTPTAVTLQPFTFTVDFGNTATPPQTATNAVISIPLPANLFNISIVSVTASGGAACPAAASFTGAPSGLTTGSEVISAAIASLPSAGNCHVVVQATPLKPQTYPIASTIAPGSGDTETNPASNSSTGNTVTSISTVHLSLAKSVTAPVSIAAGAGVNNGGGTVIPFGTPVTFQMVYTNNSPFDIPVGLTGDQWGDAESAGTIAPAGASTGAITCTATGNSICPTFAIPGDVDPATGTNGQPFFTNLSGVVLKANSSITIRFTRTFTAPSCGSVDIRNRQYWYGSGSNVTAYANIVWDAPNYGNESYVNFTLAPNPNQATCASVGIQPSVSKTLDNVTDSSGAVKAVPEIQADGDTAHYTVTFIGDPNTTLNIHFLDLLEAYLAPTFYPANSVGETMTIDSCTLSPAGGAGVCPDFGFPYPVTVGTPNNVNFNNYPNGNVMLGPGQAATLKFSLKYTLLMPLICTGRLGYVQNQVQWHAFGAPPGTVYSGNTGGTVYAAGDPLYLFRNAPRCVDMTANKQINPPNPNSGSTITFALDYANSTSASTSNTVNPPPTLANVSVTDTLGAVFTPSSVSCATIAGTATPPAVSLANITGADHTFSAVIPSIGDAAIVRCTITGSSSLPGSYVNATTVAVPSSSGFIDPYSANDTSSVGYGVVGPQVALSKTASPSGSVSPGGIITYTVVASNGGVVPADGTVVADPLAAGLASYSWTCSASGGAVCPAASSGSSGSGGTPINETVATFPVGASVTYTITALVDSVLPSSTIINTASSAPPPNSSCLPGNTPPPCTASASNFVLPQISISKSSSFAGAVPANGAITYTVVVSNTGGVAADGTAVSDAMPSGIASQNWTCAVAGGAVASTCSGSGTLSDTLGTFPAGASVTYTIVATASASPPATVVNTASATPPGNGICAPANTPPPCTASVTNPASSRVGIDKTSTTGSSLMPGGAVTYTVTVTNTGSVAADGTSVGDPVPAGIASQAWTCATAGGTVAAACSGSGALSDTLTSFPIGASVIYTVTAQVSANPPATVTNIASVTPPVGGTCSPCTGTVEKSVQKTSEPVAIPLLGAPTIGLLTLILLAAGFWTAWPSRDFERRSDRR